MSTDFNCTSDEDEDSGSALIDFVVDDCHIA
jgi:hypothetical protein